MAKAGFKRSLALGIAAITLILVVWLSKQFNNPSVQVGGVLPGGQTFSLVSTLTEHTDAVSSLAISPDSTTLASGSHDKTIKLWNLKTGELLRTLEGHQDGVLSVSISPDGETLASGGIDSTLHLWKLATGQSLKTLPSDGGWITSLAISPDGETLAGGRTGNLINLWNMKSARLTETLKEKISLPILSLATSPNGQTLASGGSDQIIRLWYLGTGQLLRLLEGHQGWITALAISPDGQTLVSGSIDTTIRLWNLNTGNSSEPLERIPTQFYLWPLVLMVNCWPAAAWTAKSKFGISRLFNGYKLFQEHIPKRSPLLPSAPMENSL